MCGVSSSALCWRKRCVCKAPKNGNVEGSGDESEKWVGGRDDSVFRRGLYGREGAVTRYLAMTKICGVGAERNSSDLPWQECEVNVVVRR